ncbi:hypothetical protein ACFL1B_06305 [Nanoarchaeota archaeon]
MKRYSSMIRSSLHMLVTGAALAFTAACESTTQPEEEVNTKPIVEITNSRQVGDRVPASHQLTVQYQDNDTEADNLPSTMIFTVDGALAGTIGLNSPQGYETFATEQLSEGTHSFEVEVCDRGELCDQDATSLETQAAHYDATLRVFDGTDFQPAVGGQLCLDDICALADNGGVVRIENVGTNPRAVSIQGAFHPNAMAGLASRRTDYNYFNLTPEMARTGHVPTDELELGENERTILLFTEDFPFEEYANRWWLPSLHDPGHDYLPPRSPHRVNFGETTFGRHTLRGQQAPVSEEEFQQLINDMDTITALVMDSVYTRIGFTKPETYTIEEVILPPPHHEGLLRFQPDRGRSYFTKYCDPLVTTCSDISFTWGLSLALDRSTSFDIVRWQTRMNVFEYFCGINTYDAAQAGGLTTAYGVNPEDIVFNPSEEELAMCVMGTAFGPRAIMRDSTPNAAPVYEK